MRFNINFMYPVYILLGNLIAWPLTCLLLPFQKASQFFAFITGLVIAAIVGIFILTPAVILGFGIWAYLGIGLFFAIAVCINMFTPDDIPDVFNLFMCLALGVFIGLTLGLFL